jgi:predicted permease
MREWQQAIWAGVTQDMRYAMRQVRKSPGFAVTVVLTVALGVGVNLAMFQLLHAVLFADLPVVRPQELYALHAVQSPYDAQWIFSYPAYERLKQASGEDAPVMAHSGISSAVVEDTRGAQERASFQLVSGNFFPILGVRAAAGRLLGAEDDDAGQTAIPVVLRYGFVKEHFGSAAAVVGERLHVNRVPVVVVGVGPEGFHGIVQGAAPDVWLPLSAQATGRFGSWMDSLGPGFEDGTKPYRSQAAIFWLWVTGRVRRGDEQRAAARWRQAIGPDLELMAGATKDARRSEVILHAPLRLVEARGGVGEWSGAYARPLWMLTGMAGLVFLAGCLNLANMQLARLVGRQREIALRMAMGASRGRVMRQLAAEDLLLALLGAAGALSACKASTALLLRWASGRGAAIPLNIHLGWVELLAGAVLITAAFVTFSLLPSWGATDGDFAMAMKSGVGNIGAQDRRRRRWPKALLAGQVSFSLLLLSMTALFGETLMKLRRADAGLDREHVLSIHLDLRNSGLEGAALRETDARLLERLRGLREVSDPALAMCRIPNCVWNTELHVAGHPELSDAAMHGEENHVSAGYFHTLGIPRLRGRGFTESDRRGGQKVVVLNQTYARQLFGDADPIGHRIGYKIAPEDREFVVVGVVGDTKVDGLRTGAPPVAYFPLEQGENAAGTLELRVRGSMAGAAADARRAIREVDAHLPVTEIVSLDAEFEDGLTTERLLAQLTALFGGLTLGLSAIGFYGLLSFQVARRTSEIGVRMALGATRAGMQSLFLRETLGILLAGIVPGTLLAAAVAHVAQSLLYGTAGMELGTIAGAVGVLLACGVAATVIPARRAARVDPVKALRQSSS